jgi:hypothetical protein
VTLPDGQTMWPRRAPGRVQRLGERGDVPHVTYERFDGGAQVIGALDVLHDAHPAPLAVRLRWRDGRVQREHRDVARTLVLEQAQQVAGGAAILDKYAKEVGAERSFDDLLHFRCDRDRLGDRTDEPRQALLGRERPRQRRSGRLEGAVDLLQTTYLRADGGKRVAGLVEDLAPVGHEAHTLLDVRVGERQLLERASVGLLQVLEPRAAARESPRKGGAPLVDGLQALGEQLLLEAKGCQTLVERGAVGPRVVGFLARAARSAVDGRERLLGGHSVLARGLRLPAKLAEPRVERLHLRVGVGTVLGELRELLLPSHATSLALMDLGAQFGQPLDEVLALLLEQQQPGV